MVLQDALPGYRRKELNGRVDLETGRSPMLDGIDKCRYRIDLQKVWCFAYSLIYEHRDFINIQSGGDRRTRLDPLGAAHDERAAPEGPGFAGNGRRCGGYWQRARR